MSRKYDLPNIALLSFLIQFSIISITIPLEVQAQSLHPILIGTAGGTAETAEVYWQFAIGEPITGTINESEVDNLSIFWLQGVLQPQENINPLPLDWLAFWGRNIDNTYNLLTWQVEHDGQNEKFIIQRSWNGVDFADLAWLNGSGIPGSKRTYQYVDSLPERQNWYYRIQQIDYNGAHTHSEIIFLEAEASFAEKIILAPNPAHDVIRIFGGTNNILNGHLEIYDSFGRLLHFLEFESVASKTISLSDWPGGVYHYLWRDTNGTPFGGSFVKQ